MNPDYKKAYETVLRELAEVEEQRKMLERRHAKLKQTRFSIEALMEEDEDVDFSALASLPAVGITDACRHALKTTRTARTAVEIRDWLEGSGYNLGVQENALASVHTIMKRLVAAGEAIPGTSSSGKATYKWAGPAWEQHMKRLKMGINQPYKPVPNAGQRLADQAELEAKMKKKS